MERRVIRAEGVHFAYEKGAEVLRGADLEVGPGLTLLVGPNGAGKSTLMRVLAGVEAPSRGSVRIRGLDLLGDGAAARRQLAYVPDQPDLSPFATLREVMRLVARLRRAAPDDAARALEWAGVAGAGGRTIRQLSTGQRRRAMLAAARIGRPPVLLLDEPLENLDAAMRPQVAAWIGERAGEGAAALVSSHDAGPFLGRAEALAEVREGRIVMHRELPPDAGGRRSFLLKLLAR